MGIHKWKDLEKKMSPARRAKVARAAEDGVREVITMGLAELRKAGGMTQADLAVAAEMSQGELSKAERREDHLVSTLRRVVTALGGELRVTAVFGDREIKLDGV